MTEVELLEQWQTQERKRSANRGRHLGGYPLLPPTPARIPTPRPDPGHLTRWTGTGRGARLRCALDLSDASSSQCARRLVDRRRTRNRQSALATDGLFKATVWRSGGWLHKANTIKEGGYAILMEIAGMDDPVNDDMEVQPFVGLRFTERARRSDGARRFNASCGYHVPHGRHGAKLSTACSPSNPSISA